MYERTTTQGVPSIPTWETLHTWLRGQVQGLIQRVLEEEVREFLGREWYQRRAEVGIASRGVVYFRGAPSGGLIVYRAQTPCAARSIGAGSVCRHSFRMDR